AAWAVGKSRMRPSRTEFWVNFGLGCPFCAIAVGGLQPLNRFVFVAHSHIRSGYKVRRDKLGLFRLQQFLKLLFGFRLSAGSSISVDHRSSEPRILGEFQPPLEFGNGVLELSRLFVAQAQDKMGQRETRIHLDGLPQLVSGGA